MVFGALESALLGLSGHALFETYSVLTRLPDDLRVDGPTAVRVIEAAFPRTAFLSVRTSASLPRLLAAQDVLVGAVFDALVAAAAVEHELPLYTRDRRAVSTYQKLGADYRLLD